MLRTPNGDTLAAVYLRSTQWRGTQTLLADEQEQFDGLQSLDASLRVASMIAGSGAQPGDVVAFLCRPSARHAVCWFAVPMIGRIASNLHVRETPERIGQALAWLGAKVLVHDDDLSELAAQAVAASGTAVVTLRLQADWASQVMSQPRFDVLAALPSPDQTAAVILTSGSTGRPKGIVHTQRTLLESARGCQQLFGSVTHHDAALLLMQPSFAAWVIITLPFVFGKGKVVYRSQFTPGGFLQALQDERITMAPLVPTTWRMVFAEDTSRYDLSSVKLSTISGEPPAVSDIEQLRAKIAPGVTSLYLASEGLAASGVAAYTEDLMQPATVAASGRPAMGVDVKIIDPAGGFDDELPQGEIGEIVISGASVAVGYWKDPAMTAERFRDRWWRSGDLGRIDAEGYLWVMGRVDNVINTGGIKVQGEDVERALLSHPAVMQCAVIGMPDERFGQRIEAYLVLRPGQPAPDAPALDAHCRGPGGLAGFKVPRHFHIVDSLPTGPTGKLYRRGLRQ